MEQPHGVTIAGEVDVDSGKANRQRVIDALRAFGASDSNLGRAFARSKLMHPSDAAAIVEILTEEAHGRVLTPARLAERIGLTPAATSSLVNRLEAAGHVVRSRNHGDRRIVGLHSTEAIHREAEDFFAPLAAELDGALQSYSAEQLNMFIDMTVRLNRIASGHSGVS